MFAPDSVSAHALSAGDVGYIATGLKTPDWVRVEDTLVSPDDITKRQVIDYRPKYHMVFVSMFPSDGRQLASFQDAFRKLIMNDAAVHIEPEVSTAMGVGYRCGFLGLLHMDVVQERLRREFGVEVIATIPSVPYRAYLNNGTMQEINAPQKMPVYEVLRHVEEIFLKVSIFTNPKYIGALIDICQRHRGIYDSLNYDNGGWAVLIYEIPLAETVLSFVDELKSLTSGYASVDMTVGHFRQSELVRVDILVDTVYIDAFTFISHKDLAQDHAAKLLVKLKHTLPRRLYSVPLQASVGGKVVARQDLPPLRKSVLAQKFDGSVSAKKRMVQRVNARRKKMQDIIYLKKIFPHLCFSPFWELMKKWTIEV